jgi:hypothetical protein
LILIKECPNTRHNDHQKGKSFPVNKGVTFCQALTPVILATQEAEIRRMEAQGQHGQIGGETLS